MMKDCITIVMGMSYATALCIVFALSICIGWQAAVLHRQSEVIIEHVVVAVARRCCEVGDDWNTS